MQSPGTVPPTGPRHLRGLPFAPGLGEGRALVYRAAPAGPTILGRTPEETPEARCRRLAGILEAVGRELESDARHVERLLDRKLAEVFRSHALMLDGIGREIDRVLREREIDLALAMRQVIEGYERAFRAKSGAVFQDKADDVADLGGRLLAALAGECGGRRRRVPPRSILVATCLFPSDTVSFKEWDVAGVVVAEGSASGHAALLTREAGIPMVGGVDLIRQVNDDDLLLIDGTRGEVTIHPDYPHRASHRRKIELDEHTRAEARRDCLLPAIAPEGKLIVVGANIGRCEDAEAAIEHGADEIGLFRTEFLELRRQRRPCPREVFKELRKTLKPCAGLGCVVRLPDLGGDKRVDYLDFSKEPNPALGRRGVRLLLSEPDLLECYLGGLAELSKERDIRILVPMVTDAAEMAQVRRRLEAECRDRGVTRVPLLGAMIETPSAALSVREIAPLADFLSIGTNDLTQYTRVADRENPLVEDYFDDGHPAVYRLISMVCRESGRVPVSVCGELASRPSEIPKLVDCGVDALSVGPGVVPAVKAMVRRAGVSLPTHASRAPMLVDREVIGILELSS